MQTDEMIELCKKHTLYTWAATDRVDPLPIVRAEGVYLYGPNDERYLDFNSQLMSVNIGHSHPSVIAAIKELPNLSSLKCARSLLGCVTV